MKKLLTILTVFVALLLAGCTSTSSSSVTYNFDDLAILQEANEAYLMKPSVVERGKENGVPYIEMIWLYTNSGDDSYDFSVEGVQLDGKDITADAKFEDLVRVKANEEKEWALRIEGEEVENAAEYSFDVLFETERDRLYHIAVKLDDKKNYNIRYEEQPVASEVTADPEPTEEEPGDAEQSTSEEATSEEEQNTADVTTEKTAWGNDVYGYITLDDSWHNFSTIDLTDEENARMLQWQSEDQLKIVTMTAWDVSVEEGMAIMTSDEEEGTYDVSFVGGDGYDYKIGVFLKEYEDDGTKLASYVFSNDYSDRSFYLAYESLGDEDLDAFSADARNVFFTHTELKKTHFLNDLLEYLASEGTESEEGASGEGSAAEVYSGGSTYPICGWYSDETLMEITIPDGCVVDMEYSDKETLVMDKKGTYATVWVNGYPDLNVNEYLKEGKVDDIYSETYDDFSAEMLEKKTLSNGFDVYTLVMKYAIKDIDYKTTYYMVSVQKDEDTGVSLNISEEEIKELGYASVDDLIRELFGE